MARGQPDHRKSAVEDSKKGQDVKPLGAPALEKLATGGKWNLGMIQAGAWPVWPAIYLLAPSQKPVWWPSLV